MSMVCSLNSDGSQANNTTSNSAVSATATATATASATGNATATAYDYTQQQQQQQQQQQLQLQQNIVDATNASTPLLLGHESMSLPPDANATPTLLPGTANYSIHATGTPSATASTTVAAATENMLSMNNATLALPGGLNFTMGATVTTNVVAAGVGGATANANDNNNNMDNASDDSNPVTIYRCRAPIASLDCMEEFSVDTLRLLGLLSIYLM